LNSIVVINKIDLDESNSAAVWKDLYEKIGYKVFLTSIKNDLGLPELKNSILNAKNLFLGHSGVGKSSLINKLFPGLNFKIGEVSNFTAKGTHTTVTSVMIKVADSTFIIDTPGLREVEPYGIEKKDLGHYFIEFSDYINNCKFSTCTHHHEPGCKVIEAVEKELINAKRYESYLRMLDTIEEDINF
jgi:ribosome biogenesis GTPase